jgi:predicted DNA-binding transcriptional regulator AlpA
MTAKSFVALTAAEVLALPAMATAEQAFAALGIGRDLGYKLIRQNDFPLPVVPIGRAIRVRRADLLDLLGLEDSDAAGGATPAASSERNNETAAKQIGSAR